MAYSTQADVELQLSEREQIELSDDPNAGVIDTDVITRAIADADADIDLYLGVRYSLPFSTVPAICRKFSVELAICNLFARRQGSIPEYRKERCEKVRESLEKIADGSLSLGSDAPSQDSDSGAKAYPASSDKTFTMGHESDSSTGSLDNY